MKTYKMVLCYDGSRYNGWQKQGNTDNTLQEKLEKILTEIAGVETEIAGSGRTDAGTHAKGQVASFRMDWKRMVGCRKMWALFLWKKRNPDSTPD